MISKECFIKSMKFIQIQQDKFNDLNKIFREYNDEFTYIFDFSVERIVIDIFEDLFNDEKTNWISWWIYETEMGVKNTKVTIEVKNRIEKSWNLNTPEKLYDFLIENLELRV